MAGSPCSPIRSATASASSSSTRKATMPSGLEIVRIPALSDNYVWLAHEARSGETMVVDPAVAEPVLAEAEKRGWRISQIWNTHWHPDHTGGNGAIKGALEIGRASCWERAQILA